MEDDTTRTTTAAEANLERYRLTIGIAGTRAGSEVLVDPEDPEIARLIDASVLVPPLSISTTPASDGAD